jgi:hypothetical protein
MLDLAQNGFGIIRDDRLPKFKSMIEITLPEIGISEISVRSALLLCCPKVASF